MLVFGSFLVFYPFQLIVSLSFVPTGVVEGDEAFAAPDLLYLFAAPDLLYFLLESLALFNGLVPLFDSLVSLFAFVLDLDFEGAVFSSDFFNFDL